MSLISSAPETELPAAMAQSKKFLFDVTFEVKQSPMQSAAENPVEDDTDVDEVEDEPAAPTFSEDEMDAARDEGFAAGREAGISDAANSIETKIIDLLGNIATGFDEIFTLQNTRSAEIFDTSINAALAVTRKCFPHLAETHGIDEIDAMVREVLSDIIEEPKAIINVPPDLQSSLEARIAMIAQQTGFEGRIGILADPQLGGSDCRVDWTGGSAERDLNALWRRIDEIIEHNLGLVTVSKTISQDQASNTDSEEIDTAAPPPAADFASTPLVDAAMSAPTVMPETSPPTPEPSPDSAPETLTEQQTAPPEDASNDPVSGASDELLADQDDLGDLVETLATETSESTTENDSVPNPAEDILLDAALDVEPGSNDAILAETAMVTEDEAAFVSSIDGESNG